MPITYQPKPQSPGFLTQALMRIGQMLGMDPHPQDQPYGLMARSLLEAQPSGKPASIGPLPEDKAYSDWLGAVHRANPDTGLDPTSGMMSGLAAGMAKVYHGSPHKFDAFDMSKIGTGEGAQAYGHGLYFAESPEVAKAYQLALDPARSDVGAKGLAHRVMQGGASVDDAIAELKRRASYSSDPTFAKKADDAIAYLRAGGENPSSFYEVDLPDEAIGKMLDWDKPLSEQPEHIRKAFGWKPSKPPEFTAKPTGHSNPEWAWSVEGFPAAPTKEAAEKIANREFGRSLVSKGKSGEQVFMDLHRKFDKGEDISKYLSSLGIPGIKYLDQGSRGAGKGTYNYVVFDDQLPTILKRNNESLAERLMR